VAAALLKIVAQVGFRPNLEDCLGCGAARLQAAENSLVELNSVHFSFDQGGLICKDCLGQTTDAATKLIDQVVLDWLSTLLNSRFVELLSYTDQAHQLIAERLLAFTREWMRAQITPRNRALDFFMEL
jgi:recombinational DNA repair protein (RecF pathway)